MRTITLLLKKTIAVIIVFVSMNLTFGQSFDYNFNKIDHILQNEIDNSTKSDQLYKILVVMSEQYDHDVMEQNTRYMDNPTARDYVINEMKRFTGELQSDVVDVMRNQRANTVKDFQTYWIFNGFACEATADVVGMLSQRDDIKMIYSDKPHKMIPEDWNPQPVQSPARGNTWNIEKVNANDVWTYYGTSGYTGNGVIIAVIDTGVNYNHTDIANNMWNGGSSYPYHGYDFVNSDNDPIDDCGHGTHVAGTIAGYGTNGTQTGMAPNAKIMAIKAYDNQGNGNVGRDIQALEFASDHGADIINMSLGISKYEGELIGGIAEYRDLMVELKNARIVVVAAAGNDGDDITIPVPYNISAPGNCPPPYLHPDQAGVLSGGTSATICIGATNYHDNLAYFSSVGPATWTEGDYIGGYYDYPYTENSETEIGLIKPDVAAPGVNIISLDYSSNTGYRVDEGTSMATPCVAGVIALMLEADPHLTPADIDMILETTAVRCEGATSKNNRTGSGRVDAYAAIQKVMGECFAPTNLSATLNGRNVDLSWTAAEGVSSYRIYRNDELIASNVTGTSYTDSNLGVGQYEYYLRSNCSDSSISDMSNIVVVDMPFYGDEIVTIGDLLYSLDLVTHEAEVIGHDDGTSAKGSLVIPSSVAYQANSYVVKSIGYGAFWGCQGFTGSLIIPNSVITIGDEAFWGCSGLTSVTIGTSVTSIGRCAFYSCSGLTSVTIGNSVTTIGYGAFENCSGFTGALTIPNSVTTIGDYAFQDCRGLTSVTIGNSVTTIGSGAFDNCSGITTVYWNAEHAIYTSFNYMNIFPTAFDDCTSLTTVIFGNSVQTIPDNAFEDCSGLTSVTIGNSVTSIGDDAFENCTSLHTIYWNAINVTNIGYDAFENCTSLTTVIFGNSVQTIPDNAFEDCSGLTSVTIGNSVTTIGSGAFYNCSGLMSVNYTGTISQWCGIYFENNTSNPCNYSHNLSISGTSLTNLDIPSDVEIIRDFAFVGCNGLTSVTIGNSVTSIGRYAFYSCSGLTSMTIGNSVTSVGECAFGNCTNLHTIYWNAVNVTSYPNYYYNPFKNCTSLATVVFGNTVQTIPDRAFKDFSGLTSVTIGNSVTTIGFKAFENCTNLHTVYWNAENVTNYLSSSSNPFYHCSNLSSVIFGNSVQTIPDYAFEDFSGLTSLTIPNSVTSIGYEAFCNCTNLHTIYWNAINVTNIGYDAFENCTSLATVVFGNTVQTIPDRAFKDCSGLTSVTIGNSVTSIGEYAFYSCSGLTSVTLPNSVTSIGDYAFRGCSSLMSITIGNSLTTIGYRAFSGCTGLTSVTIPNSVITIGGESFKNCIGLTSITIGNSVTSIGSGAFDNCSGLILVNYTGTISQWCGIIFADNYSNPCFYSHNLFINGTPITDLNIPSDVEIIGDYAFAGCSGLTSVTIGNSVTSIGKCAFYSCSGMTSVTIGNSVTMIGDYAFKYCSNIYYIRIETDIPPTVTSDTFYRAYNAILFVPCDKQEDYKTANYWSYFNTIVDSRYNLVITQNDALGGEISVLKYADCDDDHCAILAVPNIGYDFGGWYVNGELSTIQPFCDFSLIDDVIFEARFARREYHEVATGASTIWSNSQTWDNGEIPSATSTVAIRNNVTVDIDATVEALGVYDNSVLTIQSGVTLVINDTLGSIDESSIIIEDGGQLIHSSNDALATLNKSIDGYTSDDDGWNLISFPLVDNGSVASVGNMLSNQYDLYYYDEPAQVWINQKDETNNFVELTAGQGYLYSNQGDGVGDAVGVKLGEGTSTTYYSPLNTYYKYSIAENLILASELATAGMPTIALGALCWYATNKTGYLQSNISIWMANVDDNELTNTSHNVSEMTLVYSGSITPKIGWNVFAFNENTFTWDGTSNIIICVQRNNGVYNRSINWKAHNPGFAAVSYKYADNAAYDMTSETYSMTTSSALRPNTIFQTVEQIGQYESYEPITMSFAGEIENGTAEVTVPLSYTGGNKLSGFNLVGNPFVHNVTSYETTNVADGCFRVNDTKTNLIVSTISNENPLKPAEGFFVKAIGDNASVTFNSSSKRDAEDKGSITMEIVQNEKIIDRFMVKEDGDNLNKISLRGNHTEIYAKSDGHKLALVPLKSNEQAVNFKSADIGMYTINVAVENMDISYLHLVDNITGANIDLLRNPSYSFYASASDNESRFRLIFDPSVSPGNSDVFAYQNGDDIIVNGNGVLQVYDVMGRMLATQRVTGVETVSKPSQDGIYIYRLINGNDVQTQKIVIR